MRKLLLPMPLLLVLACGGGDSDLDVQISVPVSVEQIGLRPIQEFIVATGTARAIGDVALAAETAGYYRLAVNQNTSRSYKLGDWVKKDQTIIYLENPDLENTVMIESKKLNLDISQREFEKQTSLYEKGGVTLLELKNAERSYIDARYAYDKALFDLTKLRIAAPFDGVIVDLPYYTPTTRADVGATMVRLMNYKTMYMEISLPGKEMERIHAGQPSRVMNYSIPDDTLHAKITQVSPALDPDTRSFKASLEIDNEELLLRPGMFVKSEIIVAKKDSAIVIPKDIILDRRHGKTVFVIERGAAQERVIGTGIQNPTSVEVVDGLKVDERLVVKGFETLQNRSKVKIIQ